MRASRLPVGGRLAAGFGAMAGLIALMAALGLVQLSGLQSTIDSIVGSHLTKLRHGTTMAEQVHIEARVLRSLVILDDPEAIRTQHAKVVAARQLYDQTRTALDAMQTTPEGLALRARVDAAAAEARVVNDRIAELAKADDDAAVRPLLLGQAIPKTQAWLDALTAKRDLQGQAIDAAVAAARAQYATSWWWLLGLAALALALALAAGLAITRSVTGPLLAANGAARRMAAGDLASPLPALAGPPGHDEGAQLIDAMHAMRQGFVTLLAGVRDNAASVATAAQQIASGNHDLSARTEQQAASLQQTAATMDELTATVRNNAASTVQATSLGQNARSVAGQGGSVMHDVVQTMGQIDEGSRRIGDIIGVIDGIAFQTNFLALNAAVEAARAGEQGRGFAVVASEVRALAVRSASAAQEIKRLIANSGQRVEQGSGLVQRAGSTMDEIQQAIDKVGSLIAEIAAASQQQTEAIGQVSQAVSDMDRMTQQNSALVEESAAATQSLSDQAQALLEAVGRFKLPA